MNVTLNNLDSANAVVSVKVQKVDFQEKVEKSLRNFRQKANIPGFRKGMAPMGMIKKMYEKSVLAEEINKSVGEALYGYIRENKVNILGEPLPNETDQKTIDFDNDSEFEFLFDLGLAPQIEIKLTKKDTVTYYNVEVTEEMVQKQSSAFTDRAGKHVPVDIVEGKDMVKGTAVELDEAGAVKEGGIRAEDTVTIPSYFKSDAEKAKFMGAAKGTTVVYNVNEACGGNEYEISHVLKIDKAGAKEITSNFAFTINEITRHVPAELNQELFDIAFGPGNVNSESEYFAKIRESIEAQLKPECDYRFWLDARPILEKKAGKVEYPEAFLKRWLLVSGENRTPQSVEDEFPAMKTELTWHLVKEKLAKDFDVKVEEVDLIEVAKAATKAQFAQYGMLDVPADMLENYSKDMLKDEKTRRNLIERAVEDKIRDAVKEKVALKEVAISQEDFYKLFDAQA